MIEHRQRVCKLTFERMLEAPRQLYGAAIGSTYQGQTETLGKHFRTVEAPTAPARTPRPAVQDTPPLFDDDTPLRPDRPGTA